MQLAYGSTLDGIKEITEEEYKNTLTEETETI